MILLFSSILTAKDCPDSTFQANFTFPKLPWPRVLPSSYFPNRIPCPCFSFSFFFPSLRITIPNPLSLFYFPFKARKRRQKRSTPFRPKQIPILLNLLSNPPKSNRKRRNLESEILSSLSAWGSGFRLLKKSVPIIYNALPNWYSWELRLGYAKESKAQFSYLGFTSYYLYLLLTFATYNTTSSYFLNIII